MRRVVALLLLATVACTDRADGVNAPPTPTPAPTTEPEPLPVTLTPTDGAPICGLYSVDWVYDPPDLHLTEQQCLVDAFEAGTPAVLVQTAGTAEGDPIITEYTVLERHLVEVVTDSTRDKFGPQKVTTYRCRELAIDGYYFRTGSCF